MNGVTVILYLVGAVMVGGGGFLAGQAMSGKPMLANVLPVTREIAGTIGIPIFMVGIGLIALATVL